MFIDIMPIFPKAKRVNSGLQKQTLHEVWVAYVCNSLVAKYLKTHTSTVTKTVNTQIHCNNTQILCIHLQFVFPTWLIQELISEIVYFHKSILYPCVVLLIS